MNLNLDDPSTDLPDHPEWYGVAEADLVYEFLQALSSVRGRGVCVRGVIRQKPTYGSDRVRRLIADVNPDVAFDVRTDLFGLPALMAADIVIGMGTTMVQTAAKIGIPGIYYTPRRTRPEDMVTNEFGLTFPMREDDGARGLIFRVAGEGTSALDPYRPRFAAVLPTDASRRIADEILDISLSD